jgi:low density lipoprotein-related protein 2
MNVRFA